MNKVMMLAIGLMVAAPVGARPVTRVTAVQSCVRTREEAFACKETFIDAMIDLRARHQARIAAAVRGDRAAVRAQGLREMEVDGGGPLAERTALCEAVAAEKPLPPDERELAALEACYAESDCAAKVACMMPVLERIMFRSAEH